MEFTPVSPKRIKHTPVRSGQKQSTESPRVTTLSTVRSRKQTMVVPVKYTESTVNQPLTGIPAGPVVKESSSRTPDGVIPAVPVTIILAPTISSSTDVITSMTTVKDVFLGVPETDDSLLPDLVVSKEPTPEDVINQSLHDPVELTQDIASTEDEQNAVDALLSLSNVCDLPPSAIEPDIEDNTLLVPIGG